MLGPVFRTYEPTRDRLVAVKVFRLDITPEQAQALADELALTADAGLFHPSIVEPVAAGVEGSVAYRADEYVAAETLDVAMRHYAPASIEKVLPFITQLAGAIDFARTAGVGHGALHPRDIFVTPEEARASGFGVVEALERVGLRAPVRRPYTAPERVDAGEWGTPADVFSLAVIAYELLAGRRPSGMGAQIGAVTEGPFAAALHAVLVRAMDEDPARRYQTALAFVSALDAAARGEGMPAAAFDDIAAERDEDEAHMALTLDEQLPDSAAGERFEAPAGQSLFDDEAVEDLAVQPVEHEGTERFADEFATAVEDEAAGDPRRVEEVEDLAVDDVEDDDRQGYVAPSLAAAGPVTAYDHEPAIAEQGRSRGAWIITIALALLVGFAGGYAVRGGGGATGSADTGAGDQTGQVDAKPYSEQAVTPSPAEPAPDVPRPGAPQAAEAPQPVSETPPAANAPATGSAASAPVTAPAPAAGATTGTVEVRSTPSGAGVTVDGAWRGRTPLNLEKLTLGRHTIRVVQPGYETAREEVTLSSQLPARELSFRLRRPAAPVPAARRAAVPPPSQAPGRAAVYTGSIYVDSRPRGARVLVDGKFIGTTPVRIPDMAVGSHVVRLQLADHRDWTTSTRVISGEESRVTGSLERNR